MYINPFVVGVMTTIMIELILVVGIAIINTFKNK